MWAVVAVLAGLLYAPSVFAKPKIDSAGKCQGHVDTETDDQGKKHIWCCEEPNGGGSCVECGSASWPNCDPANPKIAITIVKPIGVVITETPERELCTSIVCEQLNCKAGALCRCEFGVKDNDEKNLFCRCAPPDVPISPKRPKLKR
jgi:hypothetical protein